MGSFNARAVFLNKFICPFICFQTQSSRCNIFKGIIHRNLKIENILIDEKNENVKIADFALSKFTSNPHNVYTPEDPKERERSGRESKRLF